jgi:hypothetical protein
MKTTIQVMLQETPLKKTKYFIVLLVIVGTGAGVGEYPFFM